MIVSDLFALPSLQDAKLAAGGEGISKTVLHVNIIEAPDIAQWVSSGTVLLTSYFAFSDFDERALKDFFKEIDKAGVVAIILKTQRLISSVPPLLVDLCDAHAIVLILIGKDVHYENVIADTLLPIINLKASLLDKHYRTDTELSSMRVKGYSQEETLNLFKEMLGYDITVQKIPGHNTVTTRHTKFEEQVVSTEMMESQNLEGFKYIKQTCFLSAKHNSLIHRIMVPIQLSVEIGCELVIHGVAELDDEHLVILESIARYIQIDLLNQRNADNIAYMNKNNLVELLLSGKIDDARNITEMLASLNMSQDSRYQVIQILLLTGESQDGYIPDAMPKRRFIQITENIKKIHPSNAYRIIEDKMTVLICLKEKDSIIDDKTLGGIFDGRAAYLAGISDVAGYTELQKLAMQAQSVIEILEALGKTNQVMTYDGLGVYKFLVGQGSREKIQDLIPRKYIDLYKGNKALFDTLVCYQQSGRNYQKTAESLYIHPKTVAYRINRIKKIGGIDIDDEDELLQLLFADRILNHEIEL